MRLVYKTDLREPYLGNTVPIWIEIRLSDEGVQSVRVWTGESIVHHATLEKKTDDE